MSTKWSRNPNPMFKSECDKQFLPRTFCDCDLEQMWRNFCSKRSFFCVKLFCLKTMMTCCSDFSCFHGIYNIFHIQKLKSVDWWSLRASGWSNGNVNVYTSTLKVLIFTRTIITKIVNSSLLQLAGIPAHFSTVTHSTASSLDLLCCFEHKKKKLVKSSIKTKLW